MSSTLTWEPSVRPKKSLPDALKMALRHAGDALPDSGPWYVGPGELGFFRGLAVAGVAGAAEVVLAIEKHSDIVLREEY